MVRMEEKFAKDAQNNKLYITKKGAIILGGLYPEYEKMMENGEYDTVTDMCNDLGLNYDEVYDYSDED